MSAEDRGGAQPGIETSLSELYEHAPCGYVSTTMDGIVIRVNETLLDWTGFRRADVVGAPIVSFLQPGSQLLFETRYLAILRLRGEAREVAFTMRKANEGSLPILLNGTVITDESGQPQAIRAAIFSSRGRQDYERKLLHSQRLAEASEFRVRILHNATSSFATATNQVELADELARTTQEAFSAATASVFLVDDSGALHLASGDPALGLACLFDEEYAPIVMAEQRTRVVTRSTAAAQTPGLADMMRDARAETLTIVSLQEATTIFGYVVVTFGRPRKFGSSDINLYETLARQAVQGISHIRMQAELERLALYDQLTGLATRHAIGHRLTATMKSTGRHPRSMALVVIDLDGFKAINDELGHAAGDSVLREIGARLLAVVRGSDTVGRFGGDEFVIICEDADPTAVARLAERLHTAIQEPLAEPAGQRRVSGSIGIAIYSGGSSQPLFPEAVFRHADEAMYSSKRAGTGQTTTVILDNMSRIAGQ